MKAALRDPVSRAVPAHMATLGLDTLATRTIPVIEKGAPA